MAEEIVASGGLLPDDIMLKVVSSQLDLLHNKVCLLSDPASYLATLIVIRCPSQHWLLDGFPRTVGQGKLLDDHLRFDPVRLRHFSSAHSALHHTQTARDTS